MTVRQQTHPELDPAITALRRSRLAAGTLLGAMTAGLVASTALPAFGIVPNTVALQILRAGMQAGVVGGVADWFAITALFRRPLGLPIPHTAILPRQKARLAKGLGQFVAGQFFTDSDVSRAIARAALPDVLADALRDPRNRTALIASVRRALPPIIGLMEDGRAAAALRGALPVLLQGEDAGRLVARSLRALVDSELHQEVLTALLARIKSGIHAREPALRSFIEDRVREQGGRLVGWAFGAGVAERVLAALHLEFDRIDPGDSSLREGFTSWALREIDRIEQERGYRSRLVDAASDLLRHESLVAWTGDLWGRLRDLVEADLRNDEGWSAVVIEAAILRLADEISTDEVTRGRIERGAQAMAQRLLPAARKALAAYIAAVVDRWDEREMADRLELRVGRDLQFIRMNGTLVGFAVGALLEAASKVFFGHLS